MFFDEPPKAFAHLRSLLRPSGRLAWVVWQPAAVNPWITVPADAVAELTGPLPFDLAGPGPFSLADPDVLHGLLGGAGFVDVAVTGHHVRARIGGGVHGHEAGEFLLDHGPLRRVLGGADPATRADALARIRAAIAPFDGDDGVRLDAAAWVVTARAGAAS